jgi:uroporphyrin-III C-methyltransferase
MEANEDLIRVTAKIGEKGNFNLVQWAFLEIAEPTIKEGFASLVRSGANRIIVLPYFLSPGRHTRGDLPEKVREAAAAHRGVSYEIAEPLSGHPKVVQAALSRIQEKSGSPNDAPKGIVYLVGAGPGDPGLLTIKARDLLSDCDVVIYDYLVNPEILRYVDHSRSEVIYAGKIGGKTQVPQEHINSLLIEHASKGKSVVRLKGGDPFIFGRGGEEALALKEAGLRFEIVPGISSALAVPAYAGIPLTHRSVSSSVAILSGVSASESGSLTEKLRAAAACDTLVILMGMTALREIIKTIRDSGREDNTEVAIIQWGTYSEQKIITGAISQIVQRAEEHNIRSPAVVVIGKVVGLHSVLSWFETAETPEYSYL